MTRRMTTERGGAAAWQDPTVGDDFAGSGGAAAWQGPTGDAGRRMPWPALVAWLLAAASALGAAFAGGIAWEARRELRAFEAEVECAWRGVAAVQAGQLETMQRELKEGRNGDEN